MSEEVKNPQPKKQSVAEMEEEIKKLELEAKKLELVDLQDRIAERKLKREEKSSRSITNGTTLKQLAANDAANQARCNHKKGGNGAEGIIAGQGDDSQYAVLKHTFGNGDTWVRCLRCGKTWKPPLREMYKTAAEYEQVVAAYQNAVHFQTRNATSGSIMYKFSDGGQHFRRVMANTNLR